MDRGDSELDPTTYLRGVQVDVVTMVAMITALVAAAPARATKPMQRALAALKAAGEELERALRAHQFGGATVDARAYDTALDRAWGAMVMRLQAWTQLPEGAFAEQERAARLLEVLAPDGLAALKLPYRAQWATLKTRLDELRARGLEADLALLAGRAFVDEARRRFDDYGRALGVTRAQSETPLPDRLALLRGAQAKVGAWVVQVLASVDPDDAASAKAARDALRPILDARESALASRKVTPDEPDAPQPDAPQPVARPSKPAPAPVA